METQRREADGLTLIAGLVLIFAAYLTAGFAIMLGSTAALLIGLLLLGVAVLVKTEPHNRILRLLTGAFGVALIVFALWLL